MNGCISYNHDLLIPEAVSHVGTSFGFNCDNLLSITINNLPDAWESSNETLATTNQSAGLYVSGIWVNSKYSTEYLSKFENRNSIPYRKLREIELPPQEFSTCDWSYINAACETFEKSNQDEKAQANFAGKFKINDVICENLSQLVGLTRTITINNIVHQVRCIGYCHDNISNGVFINKKAALTFEFVELYTMETNVTGKIWWNKENAKTKYLEGEVSKYLVDTIFAEIPDELRNCIKFVSKKTGDQSTTTSQEYIKISNIETPSQQLFLLSAPEMGLDNSYRWSIPVNEGEVYSYYNIHTEAKDKIKYSVGPKVAESYWLRSPYGYRDEFESYCAFCIWSTGTLNDTNTVDSKLAVAPAFCI